MAFPEIHSEKLKVDWHHLKRAPQYLKQKVNIGSHTVDEEFDKLCNEFDVIEISFNRLNEYIKKYCDSSLSILKLSIDIGMCLRNLFDPNIGRDDLNEVQNAVGNEHSRLIFEEENRVFENAEKFIEVLNIIEIPVKAEMKLLESKIQSTVKGIIDIIKNIRKNVKERNNQLLDYDRYRNSLENIAEKSNKIENTYALERKLIRSKEKYEVKNSMLKKELPYFFKLVTGLSYPLFVMIYYVQLTMSYQFSNNLRSLSEEFNINVPILLNDKNYEKLSESFDSKNKTAVESVNRLSIIKFHQNFLNSLTKNERNAPVAEKSDSVNSHSTILGNTYCTAKFNYKAQSTDDLSFMVGDKIRVIDQTGEWWKGEMNGVTGIFPFNYVKLD